MIEIIKQYRAAGFRFFGLHTIVGGMCACGDPSCEAVGKHPVMASWQSVPVWSDEQFEVQQEVGKYETGVGILCDGFLVVDIDIRNGGKRVQEWEDACCFIVQTGGGGWHYYFSLPEGSGALKAHHEDYKGIDFKSSGMVVGAGSLHATGNRYTILKGSPEQTCPAPQSLIDMLTKEATYRSTIDGKLADVAFDELQEVVMAIPDYDDYEPWVQVGMGIHHTTDGSVEGMELWRKWSGQSKKYDGKGFDSKWHSFGKSANPITFGTLLHLAEQNGYIQPVTFEVADEVIDADIPVVDPKSIDTNHVDLLRPMGLVGRIAEWINSHCLYPREHTSVAAALHLMGNITGLNQVDDLTGVTSNTMMLIVSGSGTGKGAVQSACATLMKEVGLMPAMYKGIKSAQEIIRNAIEHQISIYDIDEIGHFFQRTKGSDTAYLSAIMPLMMELFTSTNGTLPISGDIRRDMIDSIQKDLKRIQKKIDDQEDVPVNQRKLAQLEADLEHAKNGLPRPFFSLMGYTTPQKFSAFIDTETVQNGFMNRAFIIREADTNPRINQNYDPQPIPDDIKHTLSALFHDGDFDVLKTNIRRDYPPRKITTTEDAKALIAEIREKFWEEGEIQKVTTGLEALTRRGAEMVQKVSLILAVSEGVRTVQQVLWAYAWVMRDYKLKRELAIGFDDHATKEEELLSRIKSMLANDEWIREGQIVNRNRMFKKPDVLKGLQYLVSKAQIVKQEGKATNGKMVAEYRLA